MHVDVLEPFIHVTSCHYFSFTICDFQAVSNLMTLLLGEGYQASLFPESK